MKCSIELYSLYPSLERSENNILVLLICIYNFTEYSLKTMLHWVPNHESSELYHRLIQNLWTHQTAEEFALILQALSCREQLLWGGYKPRNTGSTGDLVEFDRLLRGCDASKCGTVFREMANSLGRVLKQKDSRLGQILSGFDDSRSSKPADYLADWYCASRISGHNHVEAIHSCCRGTTCIFLILDRLFRNLE